MAMALQHGTIRLLLEGHPFQHERPILQVGKKFPTSAGTSVLYCLVDADATIQANVSDGAPEAELGDFVQLHVWDMVRCQEATMLHVQSWARTSSMVGQEELRNAPTPLRQPQSSELGGEARRNPGQFAENPYSRTFGQDSFFFSLSQDPDRPNHAEQPHPAAPCEQRAAPRREPDPHAASYGGNSTMSYGWAPAPLAASPDRRQHANQAAQQPGLDAPTGRPYRSNVVQPPAGGGGGGFPPAQLAPAHMPQPPAYQQSLQGQQVWQQPPAPWSIPGQPAAAPPAAPTMSTGMPVQAGVPQPILPNSSPQRTQRPAIGSAGAPFNGPASSTNKGLTINVLSSFQGNWLLVARVTKKTPKRPFKRDREGKLFNIDLMDREGTETRATFFNAAADKFFDMIEAGQFYSFKGGKVKKGDMRFCPYDWEITFDEKASVTLDTDPGFFPKMAVSPLPTLAELESQEEKALIDFVAVIVEADQPVDFTRKDNTNSKRQNFTLMDDSGTSCNLTLWDEFCTTEWKVGNVLVAKRASVSSFRGKSLNSRATTCFLQGEEAIGVHDRVAELTRWYNEQGASALSSARPLSEKARPAVLQTIEEMKGDAKDLESPGAETLPAEGETGRQQQKYHTLSPVTLTALPHDKPPFYMACTEEVPAEKKEGQMRACYKKLEPVGDCWTCAAGHRCQEPAARWLCMFTVVDHTGTQRGVSSFDEAGQVIMGCKAEEAARCWDRRECDANVQRELEKLFENACYKRFRLRARTKKEFWNDEERLKVQAVDVTPLNLVQDGRLKLQEVLHSLAAME